MRDKLSRRDFVAGSLAAGLLQERAARYRIIDPHVHVWKKDPRYPWAKETTRPPEKDATPEMLIGLMKANGVEKTVLVEAHCGYARALAVVRDEMKFLSEEDKSWILGKTVERVWPFD